jgi:hypothetical protein
MFNRSFLTLVLVVLAIIALLIWIVPHIHVS